MKSLAYLRTVVCVAAATLSVTALAQNNASSSSPANGQGGAVPPPLQLDLNYSYDAPSSAKFQGSKLANSDASALSLGADTHYDLANGWFVPLGIHADNYFLGGVNGAPVPDEIYTLHFRTGLGWRMNDQWTFTGVAGPMVYRLDDIHSDDLGAFGAFVAAYRMDSEFAWNFGLTVSPDSDVPVLPIVGLHWRINDLYTLEVGAPRTRLTYHADTPWSIYSGLDMSGSVFRSGEGLGTRTGFPQYNNALGTYRDIRLGVGAGYEIGRGLAAELEAGYSVYREIDYKDIGQAVDFDPAPYVRVGLNYRF